jgi:hypothetical protein
MNSVNPNMLNSGLPHAKSANMSIFETPHTTVSPRPSESEEPRTPFDRILADNKEHYRMDENVRRDILDTGSERQDDYGSFAQLEPLDNDAQRVDSRPQEPMRAATESNDRPENGTHRPTTDSTENQTTNQRAESNERSALAAEAAPTEPSARPVDDPNTRQMSPEKNRSFLHRLRARLATLGLGKGSSHRQQTQRNNLTDLASRNELQLTNSLNRRAQALTTQSAVDMATDVVRATHDKSVGNDQNAQQPAKEQRTDTPAPMTDREGNKNVDRAPSQRSADSPGNPLEREGRGDVRTARQNTQNQERGDTQSNNNGRETSKGSPEKSSDSTRFEQAVRSHGQSAQDRTARGGVQLHQTTNKAEASSGDIDLDTDTARLVSKLASKTSTTVGRSGTSARVNSGAQQATELKQLHQRIADHIDRAQIKTSGQRAKLTLHLAELGEVHVNVRIRMDGTAQGRVQVLMQTADAQTVSLLRQGSSALHAALEARGYQQPILEVGQTPDQNNGDHMDRGGDPASTHQDAEDDAMHHEANLAAMDRRRRDGVTPSKTSTTPSKTEKGLHVVA